MDSRRVSGIALKTRVRVVRLAGVALGLVLFVAAWPKMMHPAAFAASIVRYHLLPVSLVNVTAMSLPCLELVFAVLLIVGRRRSAAGLGALTMMSVFLAALVSARVRGLNISCGCFGAGGGVIGWSEFARDVLLVGLALLVYVEARRASRVRSRSDADAVCQPSSRPDGTVEGAS